MIYRSKHHFKNPKSRHFCNRKCNKEGQSGRKTWNKGLKKETDKRIKSTSSTRKGKSWEKIYGEKKAKEMRKNQSENMLGSVSSRKDKTFENFYGEDQAIEMKKKMSQANSGDKNSMFGLKADKHPKFGFKHTSEMKKKARHTAIKRIAKQKIKGRPLMPNIGKYEELILNLLEENFNYTILRQHRIAGYFLDGYCPALNLAIEVDELSHFNGVQLREKDIIRQEEIENELGCKFLRIDLRGAVA